MHDGEDLNDVSRGVRWRIGRNEGQDLTKARDSVRR
jgi:hypothetical protein